MAWKHQLRVVYPTPQAYQGVLANVSIATGLLTMALMLTGKFVFQYMGWTAAAVATPIVMAVSGAAFFGLSLAAQFGWSVPGVASTDLALIGVTAGVITQVGVLASFLNSKLQPCATHRLTKLTGIFCQKCSIDK